MITPEDNLRLAYVVEVLDYILGTDDLLVLVEQTVIKEARDMIESVCIKDTHESNA